MHVYLAWQFIDLSCESFHSGCNRILYKISDCNIHTFCLSHTEPSLIEVLYELHLVHASWYWIGLQLDIPYHKLDCLKIEYPDPSHAMHEMLKLADPHPTWAAVVTALRSPRVDEKNIAAHLESKYCKPVQYMMGKFLLYRIERSTGFVTHTQVQRV